MSTGTERERSPWSLAYEEYACNPHPPGRLRLTYFTAVNGTVQYRQQCLRCGRTAKVFKKTDLSPQQVREAVEFDKAIEDRWRAAIQHRADQINEERRDEWFGQYNDYLATPRWAAIRRLVLDRDNWTCRGCLVNRATQVHHLTYAHVGNELMFELVAICDECHQRVHEK